MYHRVDIGLLQRACLPRDKKNLTRKTGQHNSNGLSTQDVMKTVVAVQGVLLQNQEQMEFYLHVSALGTKTYHDLQTEVLMRCLRSSCFFL